jgi:hypothetical protein
MFRQDTTADILEVPRNTILLVRLCFVELYCLDLGRHFEFFLICFICFIAFSFWLIKPLSLSLGLLCMWSWPWWLYSCGLLSKSFGCHVNTALLTSAPRWHLGSCCDDLHFPLIILWTCRVIVSQNKYVLLFQLRWLKSVFLSFVRLISFFP